MSLSVRYGFDGMTDPDAAAYVAAVEAADGQLLEYATGQAINDFVVGCKNDRIWTAIKASCILAGARTLSGALVPLVGTAPTKHGTEGGWNYNRKTGLAGNGTNNYVNTNRASNASPQNSAHICAYVSALQTNGTVAYLMGSAADATPSNALHFASTYSTNPNSYVFRCNGQGAFTRATQTAGLFGLNRSNGNDFASRHAGQTVAHSQVSPVSSASTGVNAFPLYVFGMNQANSLQLPSVARIPFYSIGESLDLALLDTRVTLLMAGIGVGVDGFDADAQTYITNVEAADGQPLEFSVKAAINQFVVGCKADGIWTAIKASCILAGARTLAGALVPLVGTAPTNNNFVSGDYNRKTGLVGNRSTKYLNSNRNNGADSQNNAHIAIYQSQAASFTNDTFTTSIGAADSNSFASQITEGRLSNNNVKFTRLRTDALAYSYVILTATNNANAFQGCSRSSSAEFTFRAGLVNTVIANSSVAQGSGNYFVLAQNNSGTPVNYSNARLAFYSIGESLDLALLDTRVTTLMSALTAAIP